MLGHDYLLLGVDADASDAQVCSAFRKAARKIHPDKNLQDVHKSEKAFHKLQQAYERIRAAIATREGTKQICPENTRLSAAEAASDPAFLQIIHEELLEASDEHWPKRLRRLTEVQLVGLRHRLQGFNCLADTSNFSGTCSTRGHQSATPLQCAKVCWRLLHVFSLECPLDYRRKGELVALLSDIKIRANQAVARGQAEDVAFRESVHAVQLLTPIGLRFSFEVCLPGMGKKEKARRHTPRTLDVETAQEHLRLLKDFHANKRSRSQRAFDNRLEELKRALILRRSQRAQREPILVRAIQSELRKRTKRVKLCGKQSPPPPFQLSSPFKRLRLMYKQSNPVQHAHVAMGCPEPLESIRLIADKQKFARLINNSYRCQEVLKSIADKQQGTGLIDSSNRVEAMQVVDSAWESAPASRVSALSQVGSPSPSLLPHGSSQNAIPMTTPNMSATSQVVSCRGQKRALPIMLHASKSILEKAVCLSSRTLAPLMPRGNCGICGKVCVCHTYESSHD